MSENKTSILLTWNTNGRIQHKITGYSLPSPRNDPELWVLAPSAPLFVANQLGAFKPSYGLLLCSQIIDIMFHNKYLLTPINKALKEARIDFLYRAEGSLGIQFFPKHELFYNTDSLEDGVRQLVSNYFYYVYNHFTEYYQLELKSLTVAIMEAYFEMLNAALANNAIGPDLDRWNVDFSHWSAYMVQAASSKYSVPKKGYDNLVKEKHILLNNALPDLIDKHKLLCTEMGII